MFFVVVAESSLALKKKFSYFCHLKIRLWYPYLVAVERQYVFAEREYIAEEAPYGHKRLLIVSCSVSVVVMQ